MDYSACLYMPERIFFYELLKILLWNKSWKAETKAEIFYSSKFRFLQFC